MGVSISSGNVLGRAAPNTELQMHKYNYTNTNTQTQECEVEDSISSGNVGRRAKGAPGCLLSQETEQHCSAISLI